MGLVRSAVRRTLKHLLKRYGYTMRRTNRRRRRHRFGRDGFSDIAQICGRWQCSVDLIVDVGANEGQTVGRVLAEYPGARVIGFEAHPPTFALLEHRYETNSSVELHNLALSNQTGRLDYFVYDKTVLNSLIPDAQFAVRFNKSGRRTTVESTTLDSFCSEQAITHIDVLKVDTEGSELTVLEGARAMLERRAIRFLYVEFNDLRARAGASGGTLLPIDDLVRPLGYRFIASYTDYVVTDGDLFGVSNALYATAPTGATSG